MPSLKSILESHTVTSLKAEIRKVKKTFNYSKLKRAELIELMLKHPTDFNHIKTAEQKERKKPTPKPTPKPPPEPEQQAQKASGSARRIKAKDTIASQKASGSARRIKAKDTEAGKEKAEREASKAKEEKDLWNNWIKSMKWLKDYDKDDLQKRMNTVDTTEQLFNNLVPKMKAEIMKHHTASRVPYDKLSEFIKTLENPVRIMRKMMLENRKYEEQVNVMETETMAEAYKMWRYSRRTI
tara:strand:- start:210 stop:929 length:720 start_codon:yes stop_codon:yes gene_type:complete